MAILTGSEIIKRINTDIIIDPFNPDQIGPNSYDLRLGGQIVILDPAHDIFDGEQGSKGRTIEMKKGEQICFMPGWFYLCHTEEYTETRNLVPCIEGRSSAARQGLSVHLSAGFGDIGFCGQWVLEVTAAIPVIVTIGQRICQISYQTIEGATVDYADKGRYNGQRGVVLSKGLGEVK